MKSKDVCYRCCNTGTLPETVFYKALELSSQAYCNCKLGERLFRNWCQSDEVMEALQRKRLAELEKALKFSEIPCKWHEKSLENLDGYESLKIQMNSYLDDFPQRRQSGIGMYLWSEKSGIGKTHAMIALCKKLIERYVAACIWITEEELYSRIRETYDLQQGERTCINKFSRVECLFIDDLGATKITAWKLEILTAILDKRLMSGKPTFFTSNYSLSQLQKRIAASSDRPQRIPSRIAQITKGFAIKMG